MKGEGWGGEEWGEVPFGELTSSESAGQLSVPVTHIISPSFPDWPLDLPDGIGEWDTLSQCREGPDWSLKQKVKCAPLYTLYPEVFPRVQSIRSEHKLYNRKTRVAVKSCIAPSGCLPRSPPVRLLAWPTWLI